MISPTQKVSGHAAIVFLFYSLFAAQPCVAEAPDENPEVFSTDIDGVDVKVFVPAKVEVFRGALLHSANTTFKTKGRWAELCKRQQWVHVVTTMKNVRKQGNRGPRLHKAAVEGLKQCGEGKDIELGVVLDEGTELKAVRYFSGDVLVGESTSAPWTFVWKSPPADSHATFVEWTLANGTTGVSNPGLITVVTPIGKHQIFLVSFPSPQPYVN